LVHLRRSITLRGADHTLVFAARSAVLVPVELLLRTPSHTRERARLAFVIDRAFVGDVFSVEALHELGALGHLALEDAPVVGLIANDVRGEEQEEVGLRLLRGL